MNDYVDPDPSADDIFVLKAEQKPANPGDAYAVGDSGSWIHMSDGSRMLDFHSQYACVGIGHRHPAMVEALVDAVKNGVGYVNEDFVTAARSSAAQKLAATAGDWASSVRFASSGTEAAELAMLMARVYTGRPTIVTQDLSYHGWTEGAAAATRIPLLSNAFLAEDESVGLRLAPTATTPYPSVPAPVCSSCPLGLEYGSCADKNGTLACVAQTEATIRALGPGQVAALITELYLGTGNWIAPEEYAPQIRELTQRLGILWINDEAVSGAGRTGKWWYYQWTGVHPDMFCAAKGLTSSAVPAGAVVANEEITTFFRSGTWLHGSTFSGHPLAMAAISANIDIIESEDVLARVQARGAEMETRLTEMAAKHPCVGSVIGRGLGWAIELVKDPATGERWVQADRWFDLSVDDETFWPGAVVVEHCRANSVYIQTFSPNVVTIVPPLLVTDEELAFGLDAVDQALSALDEQLPANATSGVTAVGAD